MRGAGPDVSVLDVHLKTLRHPLGLLKNELPRPGITSGSIPATHDVVACGEAPASIRCASGGIRSAARSGRVAVKNVSPTPAT